MLKEIFSIVKLLKSFNSLKPGLDMSYAQIIYQRMKEIKDRVLPYDEEEFDDYQPQII
jgi:hypothetical protein